MVFIKPTFNGEYEPWKPLRVQLDGHQGSLVVLEYFMGRSSSCTTVTTLNAIPKDRASKLKITAPAQWLFCPDRKHFRHWPVLKECCSTADSACHVELSSCEVINGREPLPEALPARVPECQHRF